jgi:hypothetical protein
MIQKRYQLVNWKRKYNPRNRSLIRQRIRKLLASFPIVCNVPVLSQGVKWEDHCRLPLEAKTYPFMATCAAASLQAAKDLEGSCDLKPMR